MKILTTKEILENGINIEDMDIIGATYQYIDPKTNQPYNGLGYYLGRNNHIQSYCYFSNGVQHGECVEFYKNGNPSEWYNVDKGIGHGEFKQWYEDGSLKIEGYRESSAVVRFKAYDKDGNLTDEKSGLTDQEKKFIKSITGEEANEK